MLPKPIEPKDYRFVINPSDHNFGEHTSTTARVGVVMGSESDWKFMSPAVDILEFFDLMHEDIVLSAHRTEERMRNYALNAHRRGILVVIAMAGGSAHLPGMMASLMPRVPTLGVAPLKSDHYAVASMIAMPGGKPLAYMGGGSEAGRNAGATNAGILAATIIAMQDEDLAAKIVAYHGRLGDSVPLQPYKV